MHKLVNILSILIKKTDRWKEGKEERKRKIIINLQCTHCKSGESMIKGEKIDSKVKSVVRRAFATMKLWVKEGQYACKYTCK